MLEFSSRKRAIASLPWYDLPEIRWATDSLWQELARQLRLAGLSNVPERLNREDAYERQWSSNNFFFGQCCGYDVRMSHVQHLQTVATPVYNAPGCEGANYSSFVVVREDAPFDSITDLRGTRCVINTPTSHSGMNVLRALVAPLHWEGRFFADVQISGSHELSLRMIQQSSVDVAAIDCVTYALLQRHRPRELAGTRVLHCTESVPAPPFVTSRSTPEDALETMREALISTLDQPTLALAKNSLGLVNVEVLSDDAYRPIESLELFAADYDYREIPGSACVIG